MSGREGQEHTDDIDCCAASSSAVVLVLKVQGGVTGSAQLLLGGDPSETPGSIISVEGRSEFHQLPQAKGEVDTLSPGGEGVGDTILFD